MRFQRRQLLQILSYTFGASIILAQNKLAIAAQKSAQPASPAPPGKAAGKHGSGGTEMERVAGIGGLFFRAHDPKALANWYLQYLGISLEHTSEGGKLITDPAMGKNLEPASLSKYEMSGGDGSEPLYRVRPSRAFGLIEKSFPKTATRWTFD